MLVSLSSIMGGFTSISVGLIVSLIGSCSKVHMPLPQFLKRGSVLRSQATNGGPLARLDIHPRIWYTVMALDTVGSKVHPSHPIGLLSLVAQAGFEPTRVDAHRLPRPERLPFRHCAVCNACSQSSRALAPNLGPAALLRTQCIMRASALPTAACVESCLTPSHEGTGIPLRHALNAE